MTILSEFVDPADLTTYVRELPVPANYGLDDVLEDVPVDDIEVAWENVTRVNRTAKFRAYDTETPIGQRDSFSRSKVLLPPLGLKLVVGEYERLILERIRSGGTSTAAIVNAIYNDAANIQGYVLNRMQLAKGDVLTDGKFTLVSENGLTTEADFGLAAITGCLVTPAGALWSDHANALVLTDLLAWRDAYIARNGQPPGRIRTDLTTLTDMLLNAEVKANIFPQQAGGPTVATPTKRDLDNLLANHLLPPIEVTDGRVDVDGTDTRVIPVGKLHFLPAREQSRSLGYTAWGITAEALELAQGDNPALTFEELPGLVGVTMREGDPVKVWTKVGGVGMPILTQPRLMTVATVR